MAEPADEPADELILEGLVTTLNPDGAPNLFPMGPLVDRGVTRLTLRPFQTSTTYRNLKRSGEGVLHITDDVLLLAQAAIGEFSSPPAMRPASSVRGMILVDCCRWFAFRVVALDDSAERTEIRCQVVEAGRCRDYFGLNRAKHAVVEAAILATRIGILPADQIRAELERLATPVQKTAGQQERAAFALLQNYVARRLMES